MSAQLSTELPTNLRRRGEIVGIVCGIFAFPFAFSGGDLGAMLPAGPTGVILPIVFASMLAGIIACAFGRSAGEATAGFAPRVGIRGALVATLAGGALTVLAATLHAFGTGHPAENGGWLTLSALVLPRSRPYQVLVITLLGIPPAIFFGMAGAFITAMLRNPPPSSGVGGAGSASQSRPARSALFAVVLVLSAIGYLSPFAVPLRPKPKPIVVAPVVAPVVEPPPPPPPKWSYRKSEFFDTAEAQNIDLSDRRMLGEIAADLPVALAPDGRNFAFCVHRDNAVSVEIRDLETLDTVGRFSPGADPTSFAWSPDSRRLFFVSEQRGRRIAVFDPAENRLYPLPQPKDAWLPDGLPLWWEPKEVLFMDGKKAVSTLDLETLRARPIEENAKWKTLSKEQQDDVQRRLFVHLSSSPRWRMALHGFVHDYDVPPKSQVWRTNEILQFALFHPVKSYARIIPTINAAVGDSFVSATDGTKLVRIRNQQAEVFYFDTRMPPSLTCRVTMPTAPDSSLADQLAKKALCVFVCAPLVNPLNGKTVGPNRDRVKALGRIAKWSEKNADVWIEEEYFPVQPGDVIADLHAWDERNPKGIGEFGRGEWWTAIEALAATSDIPTLKETPPIDRNLRLIFGAGRGADRLDSIDASRPHKTAAVTGSPSGPLPTAPTFLPPKSPDVPPEVKGRLIGFIQLHHVKSSRNDVTGMLADYGERIDYLSHGIVDRNFIRKDETGYHSPGTRVLETVRPTPVIEELAGGGYAANYSMAFEWHQANGRWSKGLADVSLQIEMTPEGPKITRQRAEVRERQQGP